MVETWKVFFKTAKVMAVALAMLVTFGACLVQLAFIYQHLNFTLRSV